LLWRRWGEATGIGAWTSGFHEEFERARGRAEITGRPEIWLFFKKIEEALCIDPGEQLQKVIRFKEQMRREKKILYKEFSEAPEWGELLDDCLYQYLVKLYMKTEVSKTAGPAIGIPCVHSFTRATSKPRGEPLESNVSVSSPLEELARRLMHEGPVPLNAVGAC
jgi:hypothetical protein